MQLALENSELSPKSLAAITQSEVSLISGSPSWNLGMSSPVKIVGTVESNNNCTQEIMVN